MPEKRDAAEPERSVRRRRQEVLLAGHTGDLDDAEAALGDEDPSVRIAALSSLARRGSLTSGALRSCLRDPDPGVRRRATELAAASADRSISVDLISLLADPDPLVAEMAAWALGERPPGPGVIDALSSTARGHEDPLCRESAVAALGALGDPRGLPAVLAGTSDKPAIRRRAVIALASFDGPEVDAALERALLDRDWQVRQAAEDLKGRGEG